ncbi:conserved Plasmodium protein, unknown function [Plasmodium ovale wallikeri]|uniref:Condensin-2 complex subunit D3 n=1 Tax=Plasmodium ovale wallikeri TaxID=864142 RepID=A0A1A8YWY5_PLAOA|nr:conserved Plasmodium protein, unknown function [Plasmodium ovale wallikeri]
MIEWLVKDRNEARNDKENNENASMSYFFSLNILLTYLIYKNDDYSNYSSLIYLNIQQWMQKDKKRLQFRMFTLKGILQRFLSCSFHFNDKEIAKLRKMDIASGASEEDLTVLKNIFVALYDSLEYIDVSNLVNINDKNCIFELIKFFIELVKRPLIHSLHILCINYLIEIVRKCYDLRFCYNINVELYDIGPNVNIFVKIVNLIFAKILSILRDTKNEENTFSLEEINNINNLIILLFTNILNSCIRIIIPPILFNDKLRHNYLLANEIKNDKEGRVKDDNISFEDKVVVNACNPVFSFIEIFLINNCDRYEKNGFIDLIKIVIKECRKIEKKYNIMKIINDEFLLYIKGDDNKKKEDKYLDRNYLRGKKISKKRFDSCASFKVSDEYSSSVYSETEAEDDEDVEEAGTEELEGADAEGLEGADAEGFEGADTEGLEGIVAEGLVEKMHPSELGVDQGDGQETGQKGTKRKVKKTVMLNRIRNRRKSVLLVDGKKYYITYESVMVRYLNFILKYMSCEKYQIRIMVLDLFLALIKKKKTKKNESIFQNLFKLFLERLEDPNMIVKAKALSILVTLTSKKYHDNYIIYKFIFNKTKEKINMYKIISSNIYNYRSNIRKISIQYIEAIFETLISRKLSYKIFLIFISNYMHSLSLDAVSSVRRQILLTVNNMFLMACEDIYIARMWLTIILSAITDIEETIKDEAISIFLNTFIKSSFQCSIFNANEKKIKDILQKNNLTYFKTPHRLGNTQEENSQNTIDQFTYEKRAKREDEKVDEIAIGFHVDDEKGRNMDLYKPQNGEDNPSASSGEHLEDFDKKQSETLNKNESIGAKERKEREEYNKNNDGVLLLINVWKIYFEEDINNYFLTLLKMMTKYDLLNFNLIIFCLKKKKNNALEEFINLLNNFIHNLRYFSIPLWNTFIFDFVIELSKEYKHKINFENVLFLLNRCYKIYLLGTRVPAERGTSGISGISGGTSGGASDGRKTNAEAEGGKTLDVDSLLNNQVRRNAMIDYILTEKDLIHEKNQCPNGILKNIMLKLFTIIYNLLDNMNELNEEFLQKMEYTIFNFTCPLCFIYITLNILIKKKKNVNEFMDKLKNKIWFYFENVDSIPHKNALCNILITFIFLIKQFNKSDPSFLTAAGLKMGKLYESASSDEENDNMNIGGRDNRGNVMVRNCLYLTQCVLLIEGVGTSKNELFSNFERDLKNSNTSMNILNNLIILTYYMIINFGSSCNKFVFILLRFFKHENSFIRYLSFYTLSKLISEDYVKFSNQFFFGFLYLLADKNEMIRKHSLSVFKHILLIYNKTNLINYIIEFIFVLNNFYNFKMSKHLTHIGNHFEIKNREDRHIIYSFLLQNLTNSEKFSLQQKLINDYLIQYVYNYDNYYFSDDNFNEKKNNKGNIIPLNDEENEGCVLLDVLHILCSRLMKIKIKKDFAKLEEKNKNIKIKNVENSVKVLNDLMKNILKKNTLPILLSLRMIMLKTKSFFFKYVNNLIIYLCLDYRDSLDDLIPEAHVKNEILSDCHSFLYVDVIHTYSDQTDFFSKYGKSNVDVNFFELSEVQAADQAVLQYRERDGEKQRGGDINKQINFSYNNNNSSSDYDDVSNVLHGIQDRNSKSSKKKKKKRGKN